MNTQEGPKMVRPLENVRIIDLTQVLAGPYCTQLLACMGAEDIRIEPPWGAYGSALYSSIPLDVRRRIWGVTQRNKKNITLNLSSERGREIFLELVRKGDVVVENFGPGVMDKLGLGYEVLKEVNPRIIYCSIKGYGQSGPWRDKVAYDPCIQAATGLLSTTGYPDRPPVKVGPSISDCLGGLYAAIGILIALHARDSITGKGQMIDCSMYDATVSILVESIAYSLFNGKATQRMGNQSIMGSPSGAYATKDGKLEFIAMQTDAQWEAFLKLIGREDILEQRLNFRDRLDRANEIDGITEAWTGTKTQQEIESLLDGLSIACAPVIDPVELGKHPHAVARDMFLEIDDMYGKISGIIGIVPKLLDTPGAVEWGVMPRGAFNEAIYAGLLGYSEEGMIKLKEDGVI
jgi:crotonobetainyl-CoA:carnitine CoA-transferase CaiB-like acyl-CoA transferase